MVRRAAIFLSVFFWSAVGFADPPFRLFKDYLWVRDGATNAQQRSIWAEDNTLTISLPKLDLPAVEKDYRHAIVRRVRVVQAQGRTELLLDLKEPAKQLASKLTFASEGEHLRIQWHSEEAAAKVATLVSDVQPDDKKSEPVKVTTGPPPVAAPVTKTTAAATLASSPTRDIRASSTPAGDKPALSNKPAVDDGKPFWQKAAMPMPRERAGGPIWTGAFFGLALTFAAAGWFMKRRRKPQLTATTDIEVLSSRSINSRQRLLLVRAAGKTLLLASTEKNVRVLSSSKEEPQPSPQAREEIRPPATTISRAPEQTPSIEQPPREPIAPLRQVKPVFRSSQPITESFMKRLSEQMAKKREEEAGALEQPNWAEGILKMRESRAERISPRPRHQTRLIG